MEPQASGMQTETETQVLRKPKTLAVTSDAFAQGRQIPREHTCHGDDVSPPLAVKDLPEGARALAVVVQDPDAPRRVFTHWTAWNIPAANTLLERGVDIVALGGVEGKNDFGSIGYRGPCPPSGTHRYTFRVFALREPLDLEPGAHVLDVWKALERDALAWGEVTGTFTRP